MARTFQGSYSGAGRRVAIVAGRFNNFIVEHLIAGATDALVRQGVSEDAIDVFRVPGSFELPPVALKAARTGRYDAVVCLGAVIRGATPHFEYVAAESAKGIAAAGLEAGIPVIYGVITADTIEQAIERAGTKAGNRGADAAMAALEMANLYGEITQELEG